MNRLAAFALLSSLSGCVAAAGGATAPLAGSQWRMLAIDGDAAARLDQARLSFAAETLGASVGCNSIGGSYRLNGGRLIAGPLTQTEMYCEGPVWGQEQALSALLVGAPQVRITDGRLTLISRGHRAEFARVAS